MQVVRKAVTGFAQVSCQGVRTFNASPSNSVVQLKCACGFKSVAKPVQKLKLLGRLENNDSLIYQDSHTKLSSWTHGCSERFKSISSLQKTSSENSNDEAAALLQIGNPPSQNSTDVSGSLSFTSQAFLLPHCSSSILTSSSDSVLVFASGNQCRFISHHTRRKGQRKRESRPLSTQKNQPNKPASDGPKEAEKDEEKDETQLTLYQRFKKTYKEHGKVLIGVHLATSAVWFGGFYTAARCGIDLVPYLESWNFSDRIISPFRSGGLGDVALAYLMYKLATPARYTVTIGGTNLAIRYLRKEGRMQPVPEGHSLRELYKEGKEDLKSRSRKRMSKIGRIRNQIRRRRTRHNHIHKDKKD